MEKLYKQRFADNPERVNNPQLKKSNVRLFQLRVFFLGCGWWAFASFIIKKSNVRLFGSRFPAGGWARSNGAGIFSREACGEWKVSRSILRGTRKQIQHRASVLLRRRRAAPLLSGVDAARMVGACFRVPSALSRVGGGLSFPSSPKKSNVRLFRSRFSGG